MSRTDSPRLSWSSSARRTIGWPPSSNTPASNDTRVRVDGAWKISATRRPARARDASGESLELGRPGQQRVSSSAGVSSAPVRKWRGKRSSVRSTIPMRLRVLTWNLMHGRARPSAGRDLRPEFTAALAGWEWDVALLQEVPPWWPEPLARRPRRRVSRWC